MKNEDDSTEQSGLDKPKLTEHIGVDIWLAFRAYERAMFAKVDALGFADITVTDSDVLALIGINGIRLTDISKKRRISKQAAHEQVQNLVRRGYLEVTPDPADKRAKIIKHSPKGRELVEALKGIKGDLNDQVKAGLSEDGLDQLKQLLKSVISAV